MKSFVNCQCSRLTESLATLCTLEGLLLGVDVSVIPEMVLSAECLATDVTSVWPLICVCPLMDQQVVGLGEVTTTESTDKLLLWSTRKQKHKNVSNKFQHNVYYDKYINIT